MYRRAFIYGRSCKGVHIRAFIYGRWYKSVYVRAFIARRACRGVVVRPSGRSSAAGRRPRTPAAGTSSCIACRKVRRGCKRVDGTVDSPKVLQEVNAINRTKKTITTLLVNNTKYLEGDPKRHYSKQDPEQP